jgi:hypothetical protein
MTSTRVAMSGLTDGTLALAKDARAPIAGGHFTRIKLMRERRFAWSVRYISGK